MYNNYLEYYSSGICDSKKDFQIGNSDSCISDNNHFKTQLFNRTKDVSDLLNLSSRELKLIDLSESDSILKQSCMLCASDDIANIRLIGHTTEEALIKIPNDESFEKQTGNEMIGTTPQSPVSRWTEHQKLIEIFRPYALTFFPEYGSNFSNNNSATTSMLDPGASGSVAVVDKKSLLKPDYKIVQSNTADIPLEQMLVNSSAQLATTETSLAPVAVNSTVEKKSKWLFWSSDKVSRIL